VAAPYTLPHEVFGSALSQVSALRGNGLRSRVRERFTGRRSVAWRAFLVLLARSHAAVRRRGLQTADVAREAISAVGAKRTLNGNPDT
jgi:hypothetical protein